MQQGGWRKQDGKTETINFRRSPTISAHEGWALVRVVSL
jgi:hypothetical protein